MCIWHHRTQHKRRGHPLVVMTWMESPHGYGDRRVLEDIDTSNFRNDVHSIQYLIHVVDLVMVEAVMAIQQVNQ